MKRILRVLGYAAETFLYAAWRLLTSGEIVASRKQAKERLQICKGCESYFQEHDVCGACLCIMKVKTRVLSARCPQDQW